MIDFADRTRIMVDLYGEVCTKTVAARILGRTLGTINVMLADGRISEACEGTMVDVRSLAHYIAAPAKEDFKARRRKQIEKTGCQWRL